MKKIVIALFGMVLFVAYVNAQQAVDNCHLKEVHTFSFLVSESELTPIGIKAGDSANLVVYAFKRHTNYKKVIRLAKQTGGILPGKVGANFVNQLTESIGEPFGRPKAEIALDQKKYGLRNYTRIVCFDQKENLPLIKKSEFEVKKIPAVPCLSFINGEGEVTFLPLNGRWRKGYYTAFFYKRS